MLRAIALSHRFQCKIHMINDRQILKIFGTEYYSMTKRLLGEADAAELVRKKYLSLHGSLSRATDCRIGIKPNLVSESQPELGATTHPEIVRAIIDYLKDAGFTDIVMLEGSWVGSRTSDVYELCGYRELSEETGVPFIDLQKDLSTALNYNEKVVNICNTALGIEFLINVPVLKGHCQTGMTCALKNLKGLLPNSEKRRFHKLGLHRPIALLNKLISQDLIITDNICGDPDFEDGGHPLVRNCIMASTDPVLTDAYGCSLMRINKSDVEYILLAEALGVGSSSLDDCEIRILNNDGSGGADGNYGAGGAETYNDKLSPSDRVISLKDAVDDIDSCSACYGYLLPALDILKNDGLFDRLDEKICIGQGYRGQHGKLGIGNCTIGFEHCIKGCPPTENQIYEGLKAYIFEHSN